MSNPSDKVSVLNLATQLYLTTDIPYFAGNGVVNFAGISVDSDVSGTVIGTVSGLGTGSNSYDARAFIRSDIDYFQGVGQITNGTYVIVTDTIQPDPKIVKVYSKENEIPVGSSEFVNRAEFEATAAGTGGKLVKLLDANGTLLAEAFSSVGLLRSFLLPEEDPARGNLEYRSFTYDMAVAIIAACNMNEQAVAERWVIGLIELQQPDGWWPFGGNTLSGEMIDPYYRTGAAMWCAYSLLWFAKRYPASSYVLLAKNAAKTYIDMALATIYVGTVSDPQYGSFKLGSGRYIITASHTLNAGAGPLGNIGGDTDQCGIIHETATGDKQIGALVWSMDPATNTEAKGGLMFRDTLHQNSSMVFFGQMPNDGVNLNWRFANRDSFGGAAVESSGTTPAQIPSLIVPPACWYRLTRTGDVYTAEVSSDRYNWVSVATGTNAAIGSACFSGLAATSRVDGTSIAVTFAETVGFAGTFAVSDIGAVNPSSSYTSIPAGTFGAAYLFDPLHVPTASSTEHNIDAYFTLKLASEVLADSSYLTKANLAAGFLVGPIWPNVGGRVRQGYSPAGPDDYLALDCHSWYSLAVRDAGYGTIADQALLYAENFLNTEVYTSGTVIGTGTGYTAYIYPDLSKSAGIWIEGTCGVILAKVAAGSRADAIAMFNGIEPFKETHGFPTKTRVDTAADQQLWTALGGTAWCVLATLPKGFWGVDENISNVVP